jgi:hypothetical protein
MRKMTAASQRKKHRPPRRLQAPRRTVMKKLRAASRPTADRLAARGLVTLRQTDQVLKQDLGPKGQWPQWSDPLDFQEVPMEEAIARVNAAGYFMHTLSGGIYKTDPSGGIKSQTPSGFNNVFACRLARSEDEN